METQEFIREYADADVKSLALLGKRFRKVDMAYAICQIQGRQLALTKLPTWAAIDGMTYPPHLNMEQCSSEQTAVYKRNLTRELLSLVKTDSETTLADLTGGFGVDFSYMAQVFTKALYVERNAQLCAIASKNFELLGLENATVKNGDSIEILHGGQSKTIFYLDPARRNADGAKVVSIEDCEPNVLQLCDELMRKSEFAIVKLSPMLFWQSAVAKLQCVTEVHILSVGNECKELLLVLSAKKRLQNDADHSSVKVVCVNDEQVFEYTERISEERETALKQRIYSVDAPLPSYLYEPNASLMKAGCFAQITEKYDLEALNPNSHLFVSEKRIPEFPGRKFEIEAVSTMNKKELKQKLAGIKQANIAVRNFPMNVDALRKRLKLRDGGETYIFATTRQNKEYILIIAKKTM